ncbi:hypothetical protein SKTS_06550 [Sulfurimicrobium lacus]|uniref:Transmembrane protein n=1 Tax=Sulfurimicrobium lacus TaxID=2715678 RepID=A0A6F8VAI6_9PROT|nr:BPSS1780 family membrane protein [Sulfurimicrobium lacus]BCB25769.1 hypothetical protein SKTS_06550 [Sulfurimicrobium lacus]
MEPTSSSNPFSAPAARVSDYAAEEEGALLSEPERLDAGRGFAWIGEGWALYREAPGMWAGIILVLGIIFIVMSMIPLVNFVVSMIMPVFVGGLMLGCHDLERGEPLEFRHLFAGFQEHFGKLFVAGLIYAVSAFVVMFLSAFAMMGTMGMSVMTGGNPGAVAPLTILLWVAVMMALLVPLLMAIWFAPALIVRHDLGAIEALTLSFKGCLRNMLPFLLYGVVTLVLAFVATIPLGLGWLVLGPVMVAAQYVGYREIFVG